MASLISKSLPNYLNHHVHPGLTLTHGMLGTALLKFQQDRPTDSKDWNLKFRRENLSRVDGDVDCIDFDDANRHFSACKIISNKLNKDDFKIEKLSNNEIKELVYNLISTLLKKQVKCYREKPMVILEKQDTGHLIQDPNKFKDYLKKNYPEDIASCDLFIANDLGNFARLLSDSDDELPLETTQSLLPSTKNLLQKHFSLRISPTYLPQKMDEFFNELRQMLNNPNCDPIEIAAFTHMRIVKLHPFENGNGRLARLLMNAILKRFNHPPIFFYSDIGYTQEVKKGLLDYKQFADYIRGKVGKFQALVQLAQRTFPNNQIEQDQFISDSGLSTCDVWIHPDASAYSQKEAESKR